MAKPKKIRLVLEVELPPQHTNRTITQLVKPDVELAAKRAVIQHNGRVTSCRIERA